MRNLKRALSLALASVMLVGMMVVGTSAVSFSDVDSDHNVEAISVLQALGVMNGYDDGGFHPEANVTRNQMAMIICALLGLDGADFTGYRPFTDVPDWAAGAVGACYVNEIVGGRGEGIYDGDAYVTGVEAAAMMLRALGYTEMPASDNWETPVIQKAAEIKLFKNLGSVNGNTFLNRNAVAQVALNALKADVVTTVKNGGDITIGDTTINLGNLEYKKVETEDWDYTQADGAYADGTSGKTLQLCEKLYEDKLTFGADKDGSENDALGRPAKTWVYDGKNVITVTDDAKYSIVVNEKSKTVTQWAEKAKKGLGFAVSPTFTGNGISGAVTATTTLQIGDVVEFYNVTDNKAATVVVTRYSVGKITEVRACDPDVKSEKEAMEDDGAAYVVEIEMPLGGSKAELFDSDITGFTGGDYVEDAYIAYVEGNDDNLIASYIPETIDGKVTATGSDFIRVDGEKYTVNDNVTASLDSEYTFVLDSNNYIIGAEETKGADVALDEVYYVVGEPYTTTDTKYGKDTVTMNIQVVAMDGTTKDFPLYSWVDATGGTDGEYDQATEADSLKGVIPASDFFTNNHFIVLEENADDDGYYDAKATLGEINSDYTANNTAVVTGTGISLKADTSSVGSGVNRVRLNSSTKYVIAEGEGADLKVHQATGGVSFTGAASDKLYAITENVKGTKVALYVVMAVSSYDSSIDSDDVVYVDADADVEQVKVGGKTRYQFEIYDNSGKTMTVISSVDISNDSNSGKTGFVTYSIKDEDGTDVYDFKAIANVNLSDKYDKQKGDKAGNFASYYEDELTLDEEYFADIKAGDAVIIDLHDKDVYGKTIRSLEDMYTAKDNGHTVALNVYLDDGAKMIVVTGVTKDEEEDASNEVGFTFKITVAGGKEYTASWGSEAGTEQDPKVATITGVSGIAANGGTNSDGAAAITLTKTTTDSNATLTKTNGTEPTAIANGALAQTELVYKVVAEDTTTTCYYKVTITLSAGTT